MNELHPTSILTRERPDLWQRAMALAVGLTGYDYAPKMPLGDGTIYACGGYSTPTPAPFVNDPPAERLRKLREQLRIEQTDGSTIYAPSQWDRWIREVEKVLPPDPHAEKRKEIERIDSEISKRRVEIDKKTNERNRLVVDISSLEQEIVDLERQKSELQAAGPVAAPVVFVPDGAMEWLLHEVGHWLVATPEERRLPNYGLTDDIAGTVGSFQKIVIPGDADHRSLREWQAWAFEEIVLAPYGPGREFAPPTQRTGVVYAKVGPMPGLALRHAELQMAASRVDAEEWRAVYGEWIRYERSKVEPSWRRWS